MRLHATKDCVILEVPVGQEDTFLAERREEIDRRVILLIMNQPRQGPGLPVAILVNGIEWLVTGDPDEVEHFQPGDECPTCLEGNMKAVGFLVEHPDRKLAFANVAYTEVWR